MKNYESKHYYNRLITTKAAMNILYNIPQLVFINYSEEL
jgi:hypothetical protein